MRITKLLAFRIFIIVFGVMTAGTALVTSLNVRWQTDRHMTIAVKTAARISDVIKRSTHYSMLLNRREDIYHTIRTIGNEPGIDVIRIYNKQGVVSFSTDTTQIGSAVDMNAEACNVCHRPNLPPPSSAGLTELTRTFRSAKGYGILGMITPIYNELSCSLADCHAHEPDQTVLGVLDVMLSLQDVETAMADTEDEQYLLALILVTAVSAITGLLIRITVNIPVGHLTRGITEIRKGNLSHRIPVLSKDEIGVLAESFNTMTENLQTARREITEWTKTLESRVEAKTEELRRAQQNMIHVEKMASLGRLAATVAHELNNPLEGVLTYAKLLRRKIAAGEISQQQAGEIHEELGLIADESARCGSIVKNLLLFSKQQIGELREEDLRELIDRSIKLIDHHLQIHSIRLVLETGTEPIFIICDGHQIGQALLALEINAVESMSDGGTLRIALQRLSDGTIEVIVQDSGSGIRDEDLPHIFEPFFTTKENGKGTGLGLAVAFGIMQRHGGSINVQSEVGRGTIFTLRFPASRPSLPELSRKEEHSE
ncbi:MAG: HAMP domain-containing protein [Ignavibacteriales bacterium]|nr:HAMP domain-containing protein [Ignavibacteriales bacterium]